MHKQGARALLRGTNGIALKQQNLCRHVARRISSSVIAHGVTFSTIIHKSLADVRFVRYFAGAHTVPLHCPYNAHTMPINKTRSAHTFSMKRTSPIPPSFLHVNNVGTVCFSNGHCMGTVWALYGHCDLSMTFREQRGTDN